MRGEEWTFTEDLLPLQVVMREDLRARPSQYELEPVLEALLVFRERIPRVADSLFGSKDTT